MGKSAPCKLAACVVFICLLCVSVVAASQWVGVYGGSDSEIANCAQATSDGGVVVAGYTESFGSGSYDFWVLTLDSDGNISWQYAYGGIGDERAYSIQQTSDGGYIVVGGTYSFGAGDSDFWVVKLSAIGDISWQKSYGGEGTDEARYVHQTSDGGYVVLGVCGSFGPGQQRFWVFKLDASGNISWQYTYGDIGLDRPCEIQQTSDGGYVLAGYTGSFGAGQFDAWILKLAATGAVTWQKTFGGISGEHAYSIQQTSDGGFVIAGDTQSSFDSLSDVWVLKLDENGGITWQKRYGNSATAERACSVRQTADGGFIVAGSIVLKLSPSGAVTWQRTYLNGVGGEIRSTAICSGNDGYFLAGSAVYGSSNDYLVAAIDLGGNVSSGCSLAQDVSISTDNSTAVGASTAVAPQPTPGVSTSTLGSAFSSSAAPVFPCHTSITIAPNNLGASVIGSSQVDLSWKDNSDNETGFKIERKLQGGSYSQIATVAANATSYSSTGLSSATEYCFRVSAYNAFGDSSYSNEDCATTAEIPAVFRVESTGNVFADRTFYGAAFETGAADIAEWVEVSEDVQPGDVLELDANVAGAYRRSSVICSSLVAGVVSTTPGFSLGGQGGDAGALLALIGIVPVKVTDEGGPIHPGDLLVTSSTHGHAMLWAGPGPCMCSLVGKALEPMDEEQGVILVLLTAH